MPIPVSRTRSSAALPSADGATETSIVPSKVYFKALDTKLSTTFSHMSRSTCTAWGRGGQCTSNRSPARSTALRKVEASSRRKVREVGGLHARLHSAGLDPREVEERVDQLEQPKR